MNFSVDLVEAFRPPSQIIVAFAFETCLHAPLILHESLELVTAGSSTFIKIRVSHGTQTIHAVIGLTGAEPCQCLLGRVPELGSVIRRSDLAGRFREDETHLGPADKMHATISGLNRLIIGVPSVEQEFLDVIS